MSYEAVSYEAVSYEAVLRLEWGRMESCGGLAA
jgi:hypothetical protein